MDEKKEQKNSALFVSLPLLAGLACRGEITCNHRCNQQGVWQNVNQNTHGRLRKKVIYVAMQYAFFRPLTPILIPNISYLLVEYQDLGR